MSSFLFKSALLLILAYLAGRGIGYLLSRRPEPKAERPKPRFLDDPLPDATPVATVPEPVAAAPVAPEAVVPEPVVPEPVVAPVVTAPPAAKAQAKSAARPAAKPKTAARAKEPAFKPSPLAAMTAAEVEAAVEAAGDPMEPARLKSAEGGKPDALLDIIGIGPVNEVQLHALGIYHFRQIAAWTPENIKWVAERIKFPTRIVRENWMKQAAEFEAGKGA